MGPSRIYPGSLTFYSLCSDISVLREGLQKGSYHFCSERGFTGFRARKPRVKLKRKKSPARNYFCPLTCPGSRGMGPFAQGLVTLPRSSPWAPCCGDPSRPQAPRLSLAGAHSLPSHVSLARQNPLPLSVPSRESSHAAQSFVMGVCV